MDSIELKAHAKINLSLDVLRKRDDGYHELKMLMQTVDLHDTVFIEASGGNIQVECGSRWVPSGRENIAYKAALLMKDKYGIKSGVKIRISKRIPVAAGLAGGSSDAAAVIKGINRMFSLGLSMEEMMELGLKVGADVPFCVRGGTMLAEGVGEVLTNLRPFEGVHLIIIKPRIGVSTAWVFKNLDLGRVTVRPDTDRLLRAVADNDINAVALNMVNVLESVTIPKYPVVQEARDRLLELGATGSMMSGSGPSVFGIFSERAAAEKAFKAAGDKRWECVLTNTVTI